MNFWRFLLRKTGRAPVFLRAHCATAASTAFNYGVAPHS